MRITLGVIALTEFISSSLSSSSTVSRVNSSQCSDSACYDAHYVCNAHSGGTEVTVYGSHFNTVAEPRISLTVITTRINNDTNTTSSTKNTHSEVTMFRLITEPVRTNIFLIMSAKL